MKNNLKEVEGNLTKEEFDYLVLVFETLKEELEKFKQKEDEKVFNKNITNVIKYASRSRRFRREIKEKLKDLYKIKDEKSFLKVLDEFINDINKEYISQDKQEEYFKAKIDLMNLIKESEIILEKIEKRRNFIEIAKISYEEWAKIISELTTEILVQDAKFNKKELEKEVSKYVVKMDKACRDIFDYKNEELLKEKEKFDYLVHNFMRKIDKIPKDEILQTYNDEVLIPIIELYPPRFWKETELKFAVKYVQDRLIKKRKKINLNS